MKHSTETSNVHKNVKLVAVIVEMNANTFSADRQKQMSHHEPQQWSAFTGQ